MHYRNLANVNSGFILFIPYLFAMTIAALNIEMLSNCSDAVVVANLFTEMCS